jgi:hypothetical protein
MKGANPAIRHSELAEARHNEKIDVAAAQKTTPFLEKKW